MAPLAFVLFRDQGLPLQACAGLSKRDNEEIERVQRTRSASPEAFSAHYYRIIQRYFYALGRKLILSLTGLT